MFPFFGGEGSSLFWTVQIIISLLFLLMILFLPKLMIWQANRKMDHTIGEIKEYENYAEDNFLEKLSTNMSEKAESKFESLKDFKMSPPTSLDPAGMVERLENVLDASEAKFDRFIERQAETDNQEELSNLQMAFKGVMGTHKLRKVLEHYKILINETKTIQLVSIINMMLPIYRELAESQKEATRAFLDGAPIGDAIGPLVVARMNESEPEEIAEDIVYSKEQIDEEKEAFLVKSDGPGANLGKYGNAIRQLSDENDVDAIITVDAAAKLEGEDTGSVAEGVGVMMGGPGVEKSKIEEVATEEGIPLEGIVVKQSAPEASKPMKEEIYQAWDQAVDKAIEVASNYENPIIVGVGNTCGVGNRRKETKQVEKLLKPYWEEYEEQEEEDVSYMGLMGALPTPDNSQKQDHLKWGLVQTLIR